MGILNVTPDSFHDGGKLTTVDAALRRCEEMIAEGADIIDIGGESTRPGAEPVPLEEELKRVLPVIESIVKRFDCTISIDTMKSHVARAALDAGAHIVNDVSAMTADPLMLEVPQTFGAGVVLNHMRGAPRTMQQNPEYSDAVQEVRDFLFERVQLLASMGLSKDRIVVDPGIGFGKSVAENLALLRRQRELLGLGFPILAGWSRKSTLGTVTGALVDRRQAASVSAALLAALNGARILRVHDVRETVEAFKVWLAAGMFDIPAPASGGKSA